MTPKIKLRPSAPAGASNPAEQMPLPHGFQQGDVQKMSRKCLHRLCSSISSHDVGRETRYPTFPESCSYTPNYACLMVSPAQHLLRSAGTNGNAPGFQQIGGDRPPQHPAARSCSTISTGEPPWAANPLHQLEHLLPLPTGASSRRWFVEQKTASFGCDISRREPIAHI